MTKLAVGIQTLFVVKVAFELTKGKSTFPPIESKLPQQKVFTLSKASDRSKKFSTQKCLSGCGDSVFFTINEYCIVSIALEILSLRSKGLLKLINSIEIQID